MKTNILFIIKKILLLILLSAGIIRSAFCNNQYEGDSVITFRGGGSVDSIGAVVRLYLNGTQNNKTYHDETVIRIHPKATYNFDSKYDAYKLFSYDTMVPSICTKLKTTFYSVNSIPLTTDAAIPVRVKVGITGTFVISRASLADLNPTSTVILEDLFTKTKTDFRTTDSYSFIISDTAKAARFVLHIAMPLTFSQKITGASCPKAKNGKAIVLPNQSGTWNYVWTNNTGEILKTTSRATSADSLSNIAAGNYRVEITEAGNNSKVTIPFEVSYNTEAVSALFDILNVKNSMLVSLKNKSTKATNYEWNFGDGTTSTEENPTHTYSHNGTYKIDLLAINATCSESNTVSLTCTVSSATAIEQLEEVHTVSIINNTNGVFVKFDSEKEIAATINAYNMSGQNIIPEMKLTVLQQQVPLDIPSDNAAMFIISILVCEKNFTYKIIR